MELPQWEEEEDKWEENQMDSMAEHTLTRGEVARMLQTFPRDEYAYLQSATFDEDMRRLFREQANGQTMLAGEKLKELVILGAPQYRRPGVIQQINKEGIPYLLSMYDRQAHGIGEMNFPPFMKLCLAYPIYLYFNKP